MTFSWQHTGLYFTQAHVQQAQSAHDRAPYQQAWQALEAATPADALQIAQHAAFLSRFSTNSGAGADAVAALVEDAVWLVSNPDRDYLDSLFITLALAQCFELVCDHPDLSAEARDTWLSRFLEQINWLNTLPADAPYLENVWLGTLNVVAGIVLEREDILQAGAAHYQQTIQEGIHPEGYIAKVVAGEDDQTFSRQLLAVKALILAAEAAAHVGLDLWGFNQRGVSVITAAMYVLYYYYYPEKWRWSQGLDLESVQALVRQHGAFFEMLNHHTGPQKMIQRLLDDMRPLYDPYGGGYTTLTHGILPKRRGLFR